MKIKGVRILKNGVKAGYVKQKDGKWKFRFLKKKKKIVGGEFTSRKVIEINIKKSELVASISKIHEEFLNAIQDIQMDQENTLEIDGEIQEETLNRGRMHLTKVRIFDRVFYDGGKIETDRFLPDYKNIGSDKKQESFYSIMSFFTNGFLRIPAVRYIGKENEIDPCWRLDREWLGPAQLPRQG